MDYIKIALNTYKYKEYIQLLNDFQRSNDYNEETKNILDEIFDYRFVNPPCSQFKYDALKIHMPSPGYPNEYVSMSSEASACEDAKLMNMPFYKFILDYYQTDDFISLIEYAPENEYTMESRVGFLNNKPYIKRVPYEDNNDNELKPKINEINYIDNKINDIREEIDEIKNSIKFHKIKKENSGKIFNKLDYNLTAAQINAFRKLGDNIPHKIYTVKKGLYALTIFYESEKEKDHIQNIMKEVFNAAEKEYKKKNNYGSDELTKTIDILSKIYEKESHLRPDRISLANIRKLAMSLLRYINSKGFNYDNYSSENQGDIGSIDLFAKYNERYTPEMADEAYNNFVDAHETSISNAYEIAEDLNSDVINYDALLYLKKNKTWSEKLEKLLNETRERLKKENIINNMDEARKKYEMASSEYNPDYDYSEDIIYTANALKDKYYN